MTWYTQDYGLSALQLELKQPREGEAALLKFVELVQRQPEAPSAPTDDDDDDSPARADRGLVQAWLMLAQSAEQRGTCR